MKPTTEKKPSSSVRVYARQRPLTKSEIDQKCTDIATSSNPHELVLKSGYTEKKYIFNHVFGGGAPQRDIFDVVVAPKIGDVLAGHNVSVLTFGQGGTGKTHTTFGETNDGAINFKEEDALGLIPRSSHKLFTILNDLRFKSEHTIRVSFVEICQEEVCDLFNKSCSLRIYEDPLKKGSVCVKNLSKITVVNVRDTYDWLTIGLRALQEACRASPSRPPSHIMFTFWVNIREINSKGEEIILAGRLDFFDIAENRSTKTLARVIKALAQKAQYVPFKESRLTRMLQHALGGNAITSVIATFSPSNSDLDETISNLEVASLAKTITNSPHVNVNRKQDDLMEELQTEISNLRKELAAARAGKGFYISESSFQEMTQSIEENKSKIKNCMNRILELEDHKVSQDLQYRSLNDSFLQTNIHLQEVRRCLDEKKNEVQQSEQQLNGLEEKQKDLKQTADQLFAVCEKTTKNEDICYRKYLDKLDASQKNAQLSQAMLTTALNSYKDCKDICHNNIADRSKAFVQLKDYSNLLRNEYDDGMKELNKISVDLEQFSRKHMLDVSELLKIDAMDFSGDNMEKVVHELVLKCHSSVKNFFANVSYEERTHIVDKLDRFSREHKKFIEKMQETINHKIEFLMDVVKVSKTIDTFLNEREEQIRHQRARDEARIALLKVQIAEDEEEERQLRAQLAALKNIQADVADLINRNENDVEIQELEEAASNYIQAPMEEMLNLKSVTKDVVAGLEQAESVMCDETTKAKEELSRYFDSMVETVQENLTSRSKELEYQLNDCGSSLARVKENLLQVVEEGSNAVEKLNYIETSQEKQRNDMKKIVDEATESLNQLNNNVDMSGHVGDTPARVNYVYPREIRGGLNLFNGLNDSIAEESTDNTEEERNGDLANGW